VSKLFILRHGNTFDKGDVIRRVGARTDLPLSASGSAQAAALAAHFERENISFTHVFSSPLQRARMTAEAVARGAKIKTLPLLTEIDYGPDEGAPEDAVIARIGAKALQDWDERAVPPPGWRVEPAALIAGWKAFFADCAILGGPILAVTSNGVARFALDAADAMAGNFSRKLKTAAWGRVEIKDNGEAVITSWNERAS